MQNVTYENTPCEGVKKEELGRPTRRNNLICSDHRVCDQGKAATYLPLYTFFFLIQRTPARRHRALGARAVWEGAQDTQEQPHKRRSQASKLTGLESHREEPHSCWARGPGGRALVTQRTRHHSAEVHRGRQNEATNGSS